MSVDNVFLDKLRETVVGAAGGLPSMMLDEIFEQGLGAKSHVAATGEHSNPLLVYRFTPDGRDAEVCSSDMQIRVKGPACCSHNETLTATGSPQGLWESTSG